MRLGTQTIPMHVDVMLTWELNDMSHTYVGFHKISYLQTDLVDLGALPSRLAVKHFLSDHTTRNMGVFPRVSFVAQERSGCLRRDLC